MSEEDLAYLLASLREATGLKYLSLPYQHVYPRCGSNEMAKKLEFLARAFGNAKERCTADFVDIIGFYDANGSSRSFWILTDRGRSRYIREYTQKVKRELKKLLRSIGTPLSPQDSAATTSG